MAHKYLQALDAESIPLCTRYRVSPFTENPYDREPCAAKTGVVNETFTREEMMEQLFCMMTHVPTGATKEELVAELMKCHDEYIHKPSPAMNSTAILFKYMAEKMDALLKQGIQDGFIEELR